MTEAARMWRPRGGVAFSTPVNKGKGKGRSPFWDPEPPEVQTNLKW